jgi:hypothetical protein
VLQLGTQRSVATVGELRITQRRRKVRMNCCCPATSPLGSQRICPFRIKCIASYLRRSSRPLLLTENQDSRRYAF